MENHSAPIVQLEEVSETKSAEGTSAGEELTIDEVIERYQNTILIGIGRFQYVLLILCGLGYAGDAMEIVVISFLIPLTREEFHTDNNTQLGILASIVFLGTVIGACIWGLLGDAVGRKFSFTVTVIFTAVFGLLCSFSTSYAMLVILRFLVGLGVGGNLPIDFSMFTEFIPTKYRGEYLVWLGLFWILGQLFVSGAAWIIIPIGGWRWLLFVCSLPFFVVAICRSLMPESPRYLLTKGKEKEARDVLLWVAQKNRVQLDTNFRLSFEQTQSPTRNSSTSQQSENSLLESTHRRPLRESFKEALLNVRILLSKEYRYTTILLWIYWFCIAYGSYGTIVFFPTYFELKGLKMDNIYLGIFLGSLGNLGSFIMIYFLVNWISRKVLLSLNLLLGAVTIFFFSYTSTLVTLFLTSILVNFFVEAGWIVLYVYTPEVYPTSIRASGLGLCSSISKVAAVLSPFLSAMMLDTPIIVSMLVFTVFFGIGGLAALLLPIETKNRKLEDLHSVEMIPESPST